MAVLVNPANAANTESTLRDVELAARTIGLQIRVINANTVREIDAAFATFSRDRPDALLVGSGPLLRRVNWSWRRMVPAILLRELTEAGGLMSYGASQTDAIRQVGVYTGRILKGRKARRPAGRAIDQVRTGHQLPRLPGCSDSKCPRHCSPALTR